MHIDSRPAFTQLTDAPAIDTRYKKAAWFSVALSMLFSLSAVAAESAQQTLTQAAQALGAADAKSIEYLGAGFDYAFGQAASTRMGWPKFNLIRYVRNASLDPWGSRLEYTRTQFENPPRGGGRQPIVGELPFTVVVAPGSPPAATLSVDLAMSVPQAFVKAALAATDVAATADKINGKPYTLITFTASNKAQMRGWFNAEHLLERAATTIDNNILGDIAYESSFSDYKDFNGIKFPGHIVQQQAGLPLLDLNVTDVKTNVALNLQPGPAMPESGPLPPENLGPGIYLLPGAYSTIAVGFKDHVTLIEAGQAGPRSLAVIAEVKRLFPDKPITELVITHPHFDHLGGVRAMVAEGLAPGGAVITHRNNKAYLQKIFTNPHTLAPDALATKPREVKIKTVDDKLTLTDGSITVELYHEQGSLHQDGILIGYLPKEKMLIEADSFNPPPAALTQAAAKPTPAAVNLLANIERLKLDVQRVIPIHAPADNRKVGLTELQLAAGKP